MSLREKLKTTGAPLSLGGASLEARDGKAIDLLRVKVLGTPHSLKGATPDPTYETEISIKDPSKA